MGGDDGGNEGEEGGGAGDWGMWAARESRRGRRGGGAVGATEPARAKGREGEIDMNREGKGKKGLSVRRPPERCEPHNTIGWLAS